MTNSLSKKKYPTFKAIYVHAFEPEIKKIRKNSLKHKNCLAANWSLDCIPMPKIQTVPQSAKFNPPPPNTKVHILNNL